MSPFECVGDMILYLAYDISHQERVYAQENVICCELIIFN